MNIVSFKLYCIVLYKGFLTWPN